MPQYLAPGVYVEELPGPRTIAGVSTSTAAFVGPTRFGPTSGRPELLTSFLDFARIFGDGVDLEFDDAGSVPNYLALGVQGFFDEGGRSLYVVRTFAATGDDVTEDHARRESQDLGPSDPAVPSLLVRARFPGQAGEMRVTFTLRVGNNVLVAVGAAMALSRVHEYDTVWAVPLAGTEGVYVVRRLEPGGELVLRGEGTDLSADDCSSVYPLTALVEIERPTVDGQGLPGFGPRVAVGEFGFDPRAVGSGITTVLTANPPTRRQALSVPIALEGADALVTPSNPADAERDANRLPGAIALAVFGSDVLATAPDPTTELADRQNSFVLEDGSDGNAPAVSDYRGDPLGFEDYQNNITDLMFNGLLALEPIDDISIVAAPGATSGWAGPSGQAQAVTKTAQEINGAVITHCEKMVYRVAALDTPAQYLPDDALNFRNLRSSTHAAVYYPWITVSHPIDDRRIDVPPAAYMAGIWARNDDSRGVIKAPANEVVRSALDLETRLNKAQQELLNPEGVNCIRFFPGPGFLVWGARTISDDPEWKYLSMRRYFNYVEKSIDEGTNWVVFEVNGPALWASVRHTIEGFLLNEWKSGALLGAKPEQGFFVRCDGSTMTPDDLDNGRLICLIGIAAAKPAEFVIFRVSQMTATLTS
jgi:phage tail sheath protein FI